MFLISLAVLAGVVIALVDIITRDESQIKHLPKVAWVLLVVFLPLIGIALWFLLGREYSGRQSENVGFGDSRRWAKPAPSSRASGPDGRSDEVDARSTEQQLADLEREIEFYNEHGKHSGES